MSLRLTEILWRLLPTVCRVFQWVTKRKPNRGKFLIVEDNAHDAFLLSRVLKKRGIASEVATSAEVAKGLVAHTYYPAVFVDMRLPGMPGEALLRLLSEEHPNVQLVIVCGEPKDLEVIPSNMFVSLIRKPASLESIEDMLSKLKL